MEVYGVCLLCPVAVEIGEPAFECSVEISHGSNVNMTLSIGNEIQLTQVLGSELKYDLSIITFVRGGN